MRKPRNVPNQLLSNNPLRHITTVDQKIAARVKAGTDPVELRRVPADSGFGKNGRTERDLAGRAVGNQVDCVEAQILRYEVGDLCHTV